MVKIQRILSMITYLFRVLFRCSVISLNLINFLKSHIYVFRIKMSEQHIGCWTLAEISRTLTSFQKGQRESLPVAAVKVLLKSLTGGKENEKLYSYER